MLGRFIVLLIILTQFLSLRAAAQSLNVYVTPDTDVATPGDRLTFTLTVANTGSVNLRDVSVQLQQPDNVSGLAGLGEALACFGSGVCIWTVGTLAPGESRQAALFTTVRTTAPPGKIQAQVIASASGAADVSKVTEITIEAIPLIRLSLAPQSGPAVPGEPFTYALTYGNLGSSSPSDVLIRMPIPQGTTFAAASDGGTLNDDLVTWNLGMLGVGTGGVVHLTVTPNAGLQDGGVIEAHGRLEPGGAATTIRSWAATPVSVNSPLKVQYTVSQNVTGQGGRVTYMLTASNEGSINLADATAWLQVPRFTTGFAAVGADIQCFGSQICVWSIGTLAPGESRQLPLFTSAVANAPQGDVMRTIMIARSSAVGTVAAAQDIHIDPTPLLRLGLAPEPGPAEPQKPLTYTLTYGNVGSGNPTNVTLKMPVPDRTTFSSATGGGTLGGDGVVSWNLGTLGVGSGGQVQMTVILQSSLRDGEIVRAAAELDPDLTTASVVHASAATPIRANNPLRVHYTVDRSVVAALDRFTYTLTVANASTVNLTDVTVWLQNPQFTTGFAAVGTSVQCFGSQVCVWNVGTLAPSESKQLGLFTSAAGSAPQGDLLRTVMIGRSTSGGNASAGVDVHVDPAPLVGLSLAATPGPAVPGSPFTYALTFGNLGSTTPTNVIVRMPIPRGTTFASASCGAIVEDGKVSWELGTLEQASGGQVYLTVTPEANLPAGTIIEGRAELDSGIAAASIVRSSTSTPIRDAAPLKVSYAANRRVLARGDAVTFTLTAENTSAVNLTDVSARLQVPRFVSGLAAIGTGLQCFGNQTCVWTVGTLAPGQSRTISFTTNLANTAPAGDILRSIAEIQATGSQQRVLSTDVLSGSLGNFAPMRAVITNPTDGATFVIGGPDAENPVSPDEPFSVAWEAACDPEGEPLTYRWQVSASPTFGTILMNEISGANGAETHFDTDFGALAGMMNAAGVPLGESRTFYHRVVTSDGTRSVTGDPASFILARGTIVSAEYEGSLPTVFALHGNYPNPFNPSTTFAFDLPTPAVVLLTVYDVAGRKVATVVDAPLPAGRFQIPWDAGRLSSGVYLYRLEAGSFTEVTKMILLR